MRQNLHVCALLWPNDGYSCIFSSTFILLRCVGLGQPRVNVKLSQLYGNYCKVKLQTIYRLCPYWTVGAINRLASCYTKCLKTFFGFPKYSSVTAMLMELGVPSFNTLIHNYNVSFFNRLNVSDNILNILVKRTMFYKL